MEERELAYIAGLFDGEGSIYAYPEETKHYRLTRVGIGIGNTDLAVIDYLKSCFGGHVGIKTLPSGKQAGHWSVSCRKAIDVLRLLYPYLRIKKKQADIAFRMYSLNGRKTRSENRNEKGQFVKLSEEDREEIRSLIEQLKALNK